MTGTVSSPEVDLHESLLARNATPSPLQVVRVSSLALVCETRGDLEIEHFADVNGEVGASPPWTAEQPCLCGLVRRAHVRVGQRVPSTGPGGVECHPPHHPVVRVLAIARRRVERQKHVGPTAPYLANELAAELQSVHEFGVAMAKELNSGGTERRR